MFDLLDLHAKINNNDAASADELKKLYSMVGLDRHICENISEYFTSDPETIAYRMEMIKDLMHSPSLFAAFTDANEKIGELVTVMSLAKVKSRQQSNEALLTTICSINSYINFIDSAYDGFINNAEKIKSRGLSDFFADIRAEKESSAYNVMRTNAKSIINKIRNIKSVTIGINLDENMLPREAGLVSVNERPYVSGGIMDKLFRLSFNDPSEFECLAPLGTIKRASDPREAQSLNYNLNMALNEVLKKNLKKCSSDIEAYFGEVADSVEKLSDALRFYTSAVRFLTGMFDAGMPLCYPEYDGGKYRISSLYNLRLCEKMGKDNVTASSLNFDNNGRIYILTGANSGGKTVYIESILTAALMYQLGLPIFAHSAVMRPFESINAYFVTKEALGTESEIYGRFEGEVRWIADKIENKNQNSLYILDEIFSGTASSDAAGIALNALVKIANDERNCCVFATHIHELAATVYRDRKENSRLSCFDTLSACEDHSIARIPPKADSRAADIASKYGL